MGHLLQSFDCGIVSLNEWLIRRALRNQAGGASRTFVSCEENHVIGYYAVAAGAVTSSASSGRLRRNMPDPVPVALLGRLAVSRFHQGKGIGRALFQDAALRILHTAENIGIRGILVHALTEEAREFYLRLGFDPSPLDRMTLMIPLQDVRACMAE